jgi:hypothetical protein
VSSFRKPVKCFRPSGSRVDGKWVEGTPKEFTIEASVQPLSGKELENLPEGRRKRAAFKLFTDTSLRTVNQENPDLVRLESASQTQGTEEVYEVITVAHWNNAVLPHYEIVISLCETDPRPA